MSSNLQVRKSLQTQHLFTKDLQARFLVSFASMLEMYSRAKKKRKIVSEEDES